MDFNAFIAIISLLINLFREEVRNFLLGKRNNCLTLALRPQGFATLVVIITSINHPSLSSIVTILPNMILH
ncbi:hypothetical protein [Helicobacter pullorum]